MKQERPAITRLAPEDQCLTCSFSTGTQPEGTVYEAQISKEHILAFFNGRNESEVVVDPKYLEQIMESPEPGFDMQMT